jgi:hypothetical protein
MRMTRGQLLLFGLKTTLQRFAPAGKTVAGGSSNDPVLGAEPAGMRQDRRKAAPEAPLAALTA